MYGYVEVRSQSIKCGRVLEAMNDDDDGDDDDDEDGSRCIICREDVSTNELND